MKAFQVNDQVLNAYPCDHCAQDATEAEALAAVKRYLELMGLANCCVCNQAIKIPSFDIEHSSGAPEGTQWLAAPSQGANPITIRIDRGSVSTAAAFHEECGRGSMPFLSEEFWEEKDKNPMWPTAIEIRKRDRT